MLKLEGTYRQKYDHEQRENDKKKYHSLKKNKIIISYSYRNEYHSKRFSTFSWLGRYSLSLNFFRQSITKFKQLEKNKAHSS